MSLSVIIRCNNEEDFIGYAIQSIIDLVPNYEIIVVDNNSMDNSREIISLFRYSSNKDKIKIISPINQKYTPGSFLNEGIKNSKNDIVLILSAHCKIKSLNLDFIKKKLNTYKCIFGKQIPIYKGKKITPRYIWNHFVDEEVENMFSDIEERYFIHNAFAFYDKNYLLKNPFNEDYPGKEDRFWAKELVDSGNKFLYSPKILANHYWTKNGATWKGIG